MRKLILMILILKLSILSMLGQDLYWFVCVTNDTSQTLHIQMGDVNTRIYLDESCIFRIGKEVCFSTRMPNFDLYPGQYFRANITMENIDTIGLSDYQQMVVTCNGKNYPYFFYNEGGSSSDEPGNDHTCTYDFEDPEIYPKVLYQYDNTPPFDCFFDQHYDDDYTFRDDMVFVDAGKGGLPTGVGTDTMTQVGNAPAYNY